MQSITTHVVLLHNIEMKISVKCYGDFNAAGSGIPVKYIS